jgi:2-iminobutanoate/2-iminopropanoate deaminase
MPTEPILPADIAPPAANYAHAVLVTDASRWLHTSGVVPVRPNGTVPPDVETQAEVVWQNLAAILGQAGMGPGAVVSVTTYVASSVAGAGLSAVMAARDAALGGRRVASTLVVVAALAQPSWLVEIALVAAA